MKKLLFIFNPYSGKAQVKYHLFEITDEFTKAGYLVTVYPTQKAMDCYDYVKENAQDYDVIVCSGGDGTLNETVSGLLSNGNVDIPVGYIPSGSTNDFATSLMIPKTIKHALANIINGSEYACDVGIFNGRYFNYVAAFGLFTDVSYATSQQLKNVLGHQAYLIESVKSFTNMKAYDIKVKTKDEEFEDRFIYGMVANSKSVGGIKGIAGKDVKLDDGLFEVILIKAPKKPMEVQTLFSGFVLQEDNSMVRHIKCDEISFESEDAVPWVLDGEFGGAQTKVDVFVNKQRVKYLIEKHP